MEQLVSSAGSSNTEPSVCKRKNHSTSPELISSSDDGDDFIPPRRRLKRKNTHESKAAKAKKVSNNSPTIPTKNDEKKKKKKCRPTIWCAPEFIKSAIEILKDCQRKRIKKLGFGWVLSLTVDALRTRNLPVFLMDNTSESLVINVGTQGGLKITPHAVHCVLGLPNGGTDPPPFSYAQKREQLLKLKELLGVSKHKNITFEVLYQRIRLGGDDDLTIRYFIIIVFNRLLFPTTAKYITGRDAAWTSDLHNLPNIDWCKVLVDDISHAVISWKSKRLAYPKRLANSKKLYEPTLSLTSCTLFCIVNFLFDNLLSMNRLDAIEIPRIAHFTNDIIANILREDTQIANGLETYGKLALRPKEGTCYFEDSQSQHLFTACPPSPPPTLRVLTNYSDNRASVHDGSSGDPNVSKEVPAKFDHLSPSGQPSQTVETLETGGLICFCTESGCSFAGPPPALLGHLATLHSWPVHKIEYGKVLWLQVPVSVPRRLLLAEDGGVFLLVVGLLNAIAVVSVVCIRASTSPSLQYPAMMWAYGPPDVAGVRCMVGTEAVTSSSKPSDVVVEKLPFVLLVPPTHVFGAGASKELSLEIRINKM
ncbi:uncharacterized protein [Triticum aestivum]|uniref:uncharacterized protein n=1 Tax=Triticum aestivum TaxID=4565 RepID=UPI001D01A6FC|nr:uncharacterized protein LOC123042071 [Triticum aestivum]